jgi:GH15 family glucan-1,4-alpha-glucosidase
MTSLDQGVIGNCQVAALVDATARITWGCFPRFDSDPTFCSLLSGNGDRQQPGFFDIEMLGLVRSEQNYLGNTPILETTLYDDSGGSVRVFDFAPRYYQYGRIFRPIMLIRQIVPVSGTPSVRIRLRPANNYGAEAARVTHGSNHIRFKAAEFPLRLTTNASLSAVLEERAFVLDRAVHLILGPDETIAEAPEKICRDMFGQTRGYWENWVRGLSIPFEWQDAVIRSAITLKLCNFEDSGAVVAALTTSIPEAANTERNWDYRYCWLRDSYYVVHALNRLGATQTMEGYLRYIINLVVELGGPEQLQPVYGVSGAADLEERIVDSLPGYRGMGPVRVGNQAYQQVQNDIYGAVVLAATQYFFDKRLSQHGGLQEFRRLELLGEQALKLFDTPDAGLWEYRGRKRVHTYSSVMCWAACDRLAKIARHLQLANETGYWRDNATKLHTRIEHTAWNEQRGAFVESSANDALDASMLTLCDLGFLAADDPRFISTVEAIGQRLKRGPYLFRYEQADDFGVPENAFNICTFWYIGALASLGRHEEARELFENMLSRCNTLGLLSEDLDPKNGELWGNFPQTYSMVGIINGAMRLSRSWEDAL